jgi:alpha-glucosidase (family GH31 glycosyl hydrolase)
MDLPYTNKGMYLEFDPNKFRDLQKLEQKVQEAGKRLVILLDPHVKVTFNDYPNMYN